MDKLEMKQTCLDLAKAAGTLFDMIDEADNIDEPMENYTGILALKMCMDETEKIRGYYARRNIQRMLALGVSPEELARMDMGR